MTEISFHQRDSAVGNRHGRERRMMTRAELENTLRGTLTARGLDSPAYAVVVPVIWDENGAALLLEVRAAGIPQAGDPCFPGGRIESGETPAQAAAREMKEELGIRVDPERFLGQLPTVYTPLGQRTNVYVCTISAEDAADVRHNPAEVSEVLRVPMAYLLRQPNAVSYPFGGHEIWGMTAGAIRHFCAAWEQAGIN